MRYLRENYGWDKPSAGSRLWDKGGGDIQTLRKGGRGGLPKTFFGLQASVWSKNKGARAPPLDPPLKPYSKIVSIT